MFGLASTPQVPFNRALGVLDRWYLGTIEGSWVGLGGGGVVKLEVQGFRV